MKKIVLVLNMIFSVTLFAYINIYPVKFEKNITSGAYEEFTLYNRTSKPRRYRVYIEEVENAKNSMAEWIEIYPKSIALKPLQEEKLQLEVKPPEGVEKGEYIANLIIKEVAIPSVEEKEEKKNRVFTMIRMRLKGKVE